MLRGKSPLECPLGRLWKCEIVKVLPVANVANSQLVLGIGYWQQFHIGKNCAPPPANCANAPTRAVLARLWAILWRVAFMVCFMLCGFCLCRALPSSHCRRIRHYLFAKFLYRLSLAHVVRLAPTGIVSRLTIHHDDEPFRVHGTNPPDKRCVANRPQFAVCHFIHIRVSIMKSMGLAILRVPRVLIFFRIPPSVVRNQLHPAASAQARCRASSCLTPEVIICSPRAIKP